MEKNKTRKYLKYAIGEIVLVVIGILIALSINNWNEQRKDKVKEEKILLGIKNDFLETIVRLKVTIKSQEEVVRWSITLTNFIEKKIPIKNTDSIGIYLAYGAFSYYRTEPVMGTYDALIGSGNTSIIENEDLLNSLSRFSAIANLDFEDELTSMDLLKLMQESTSDYFYVLYPDVARQYSGLEHNYSEEDKQSAIKKLMINKPFLSYLIQRINSEEYRLDRQKSLLKFANEVLTYLETKK